MIMNGKAIETLNDLKENISFSELLYEFECYGLEIWLRRLDENELADKVSGIKHNAYSLIELCKILEIDPNMTEEEIHDSFGNGSDKCSCD